MNRLEDECNMKIRQALPYRLHLFDSVEDAKKDERLRTRGLENAAGSVRVIEIEGVDMNTCCGTHVRASSELQVNAYRGADVLLACVFDPLAGGEVL